jgi:MFS family permease
MLFRNRLPPPFPGIVWAVLAGTLLIRTTSFLVWPFLSIILLRRYHISPSEVGLILGLSALVSSTSAFYLGNLSDRFGRRDVIVGGCVVNVVACAIFATADRVVLYALGAVLVGFARAAVEAPSNGLIAESIPEARTRELAFHGRYFLANVGASVGPLLGFTLGLATQQSTFLITACAYAIYAAVILRGFRNVPHTHAFHDGSDSRFAAAVRTLKSDRRFLLVIVSTFFAYAAYAQVESTLVQYLSLAGRMSGVGIATSIIATNGITIILFQFPLLRLLRRYGLHFRIQIGLLLFVAGFLVYSVLPPAGCAGWITATLVLSLGEAILFPTLNLQADLLAPSHLRGSYFGALSLAGLGFAAGPFVGGVVLQYLGGPWTFLTTAVVTVFGGVCYWRSDRMIAPALLSVSVNSPD